MKGQTQAVTAVLITGVIVGGIASAYVWGVPLVQKRQSQAELGTLESSIMNLESSILSVARSGSGSSESVTLELGNGKVFVNQSGNYIDITTFADSAPYPVGTWTLLKGQSRQGLSIGAGDYGIQGKNTPGVVAVKRVGASNSVVKYRVEFRNLRTTTSTGSQLNIVDLESEGAKEASGKVTVQFTNERINIERGADGYELSSGATINQREVVVSVDLR